MTRTAVGLTFLLLAMLSATAREYHVAKTGDDSADGSVARPLRTIQAAAERAKTVIALVNRQMPRSLGDAQVVVRAAQVKRLRIEHG